MIERRESATDRRVELVSLTPTSERLVAQHIEAKRESVKAFTDALPPEHREDLYRALTNILAGDVLRPRPDQETVAVSGLLTLPSSTSLSAWPVRALPPSSF